MAVSLIPRIEPISFFNLSRTSPDAAKRCAGRVRSVGNARAGCVQGEVCAGARLCCKPSFCPERHSGAQRGSRGAYPRPAAHALVSAVASPLSSSNPPLRGAARTTNNDSSSSQLLETFGSLAGAAQARKTDLVLELMSLDEATGLRRFFESSLACAAVSGQS